MYGSSHPPAEEEAALSASRFEPVTGRWIPEQASHARVWRHTRTGAEILTLQNADQCRAFGILFRTPPPDRTGLPHVLEHCVLGGSRRYPVRGPLDEVLRGSVFDHVNVVTYPDKACYLVASSNSTDLANVADVFLDAVLHPLLTPDTFRREAWHLEMDSVESLPRLNGRVLNEQHGNFSAPARLIEHHSQVPLFPDTPYGVNRGGHPEHIPEMTLDRLRAYHRIHYHPSNARFYLYGAVDVEEWLRFLDDRLDGFDRQETDTSLPLQSPFRRPRRVRIPFEAGPGQERGMVTLNWVLGEVRDPEEILTAEVLTEILIGTPRALLRRALVESGLGTGLAGLGLFTHVRQMYLSTGLQGVAPADASGVEPLVEHALGELVLRGVDSSLVAEALRTVEMRLREPGRRGFPPGAALFWDRVSPVWVHDGDSLGPLAYQRPLGLVAERLQREGGVAGFVRSLLVDNPHRATVALMPDLGFHQRAAERGQLADKIESLSKIERRQLVAETRAYRQRQAMPDDPGALAAVPALMPGHLARNARVSRTRIANVDGCSLLHDSSPTRGLVHVELALDLRVLPEALVLYVPLLGRLLADDSGCGYSADASGRGVASAIGGLRSSVIATASRSAGGSVGRLVFCGKAREELLSALSGEMRRAISERGLPSQARCRQTILEERARLLADVQPDSRTWTSTRIGSAFGEHGRLADQTSGVAQLQFLRALVAEIDEDWPGALEKLEETRRLLLGRAGAVCSVTSGGILWDHLPSHVASLTSSLPVASCDVQMWRPELDLADEGLVVGTQVNHVAKGADLYALGYELHGSIAAITRYLEAAWLRERVCAQGGAYGVSCTFNARTGLFVCSSYRDPHLGRTVDVFDGAATFLRENVPGSGDLARTVVGAVGRMDAYRTVAQRARESLLRHLCRETDAERQRFRDELLGTGVADIRAFAEVLAQVREEGLVVALASVEAIAAANAQRHDWLRVTRLE